MNSAPLERLKKIFHSARELPAEKREAFLDRACGDDHELRREVDALLESDCQAAGFITDPPAELAAELFGSASEQANVGRKIGQYRIVECVGSGGMGTVYLAERADQQFKMQVAIKLIKRGMDSDQVLRRFQHERQILASLEHPNIARLLDGGTTEDGLPYFVMEHIRGERIDLYAEHQGLSINARLELFRQVCSAVSYAHQHLVVHRDLKPSNILVTPEGVPKLLDFGIAKIVQADGAEALATLTAMPAMTPEYASPEQIEGTPATTLSDVYSLGAVLYELLSGRPPFRLQTRTPQEAVRAINTQPIEKPSTVVKQTEDARRLRGDLDNIVLMAMRKETTRRYRSVEQFSEDIGRHLAGRTVIARSDTLSYRAGKFLHRNKVGVAAAALLLLTLIGGIVATAWQAKRAREAQARAERRFNEVRALAHSVLFDYHDAIKSLPGATKIRERLVEDGLNYLDSLAGEAHGDPALQRELADAYERVGEVRGGTSGGNLGDLAGAMESQTKAFRIREALATAHPHDSQARRDLASSHLKIGRLLSATDIDGDEEHLRKAQALYLDLTRENPADGELQLQLADTEIQLSGPLSGRGEGAGALEHLRTAVAICEKLAAGDPHDPRYRRKLWIAHGATGYVLGAQNDDAGAIEAQKRALALGEELLAEDPTNADYRRALAVSYQQSGDARRESDKSMALADFRRAAALQEESLGVDPANARMRKDLAYTQKKIADFLLELGEDTQALSHFNSALENYQKVVTGAPADLVSTFLVITCRAGAARMRARQGEVGAALEDCGQAMSLLQKTTGGQPGHLGRAQAYEYLGHAHLALAASPKATASENRQRTGAAREMFQESLKIIDDARRLGTLGSNEDWAKEITDEIAKCDTALKN